VPSSDRAGTGSFEFEAASGVYSELQCGSYVFMDADYGRNLDRDGIPTKAFEPSLFIWATVMSRGRGPGHRRTKLKKAQLTRNSRNFGKLTSNFTGLTINSLTQ
jgi:D-serine deaminase-like pyridoxal phosphate-dependent protein